MCVFSAASKPAFTILAVVLGFVVHGAQAAASCGDYLHTVHSRPGQHVAPSAAQHAAPDHTAAANHQTDYPAVPCSGPGCERDDGPVRPPLIPTTGGASPGSDALLNSAARLAVPSGQVRVPAASATPRAGFPSQPEKPPRSIRASVPVTGSPARCAKSNSIHGIAAGDCAALNFWLVA